MVKKLPVWLGNLIEVAGITFGSIVLLLDRSLLSLLISWFCFWYFSHCITHYIVGKIFGIKFLYYFVGKSAILKLNLQIFKFFKIFPVLGIKVDKDSIKRVSKKRKAIFYSSGAFASMFSPIICLFFTKDFTSFLILATLTVLNIAFTLIFSSKVGDLYKARNL
ncbi:MAG: hypothetical protein NZ895_01920 [Archaeoglobaceae archaeon]|nr:hypothetical protein [Archaeoglobaceae archaeon]MCX8151560.1 hypothetical protein [Archaeoglobaceae archaeon]MDW8013162.1 hypothetical protein [Archaeoglobaceae archaeon]